MNEDDDNGRLLRKSANVGGITVNLGRPSAEPTRPSEMNAPTIQAEFSSDIDEEVNAVWYRIILISF